MLDDWVQWFYTFPLPDRIMKTYRWFAKCKKKNDKSSNFQSDLLFFFFVSLSSNRRYVINVLKWIIENKIKNKTQFDIDSMTNIIFRRFFFRDSENYMFFFSSKLNSLISIFINVKLPLNSSVFFFSFILFSLVKCLLCRIGIFFLSDLFETSGKSISYKRKKVLVFFPDANWIVKKKK